ncbi:SpoIIE family protein phosphatase [Streptomyces sp. GC420]|uniref:SpoIIE family protein phosphatase n=1 Tax=Streptomyces sp. GC420 TaxID=2697568 RepID=UPI001414FF39|nr:SpoIIE family protein phosphatase [Streptomyces sp. GC420]NBM14821.1 SpoIIE family protein phosphatase [Streptomyces sp. GC420]
MAPAAARRFVRGALSGWTAVGLPGTERIDERLAEDAVLLVSELVTNAVVHAGTAVDVLCRIEEAYDGEPAALRVEVGDHHPARAVRREASAPFEEAPGLREYGRGLGLVAALSESWGITYRGNRKAVWARLSVGVPDPASAFDPLGLSVADILAPARPPYAPEAVESPARTGHGHGLRDGHGDGHGQESAPGGEHRRAEGPGQEEGRGAGRGWGEERDWISRGALTFLAEASDLLTGQLDEDMVAALACQLLVPRLADWCAVWLGDENGTGRHPGTSRPAGPSRLARVWHRSENLIDELRAALEKDPPAVPGDGTPQPVPVRPPSFAPAGEGDGTAVAYPLLAGGRTLGVLLLGRTVEPRLPDEVTGLVEDFARRVALAIGAARQYARQVTISRVLQQGLLPSAVAEIPGVESALVYEPRGQGVAGGDFYDVFPAGDGRWCFALGDVCGNGPEAAVVTGLARPWLRLLAREGYQAAEVLDRLNRLLLDDATEAAEASVSAGAGDPSRFLSVLYGELVPEREGVRCTLSSAGHPLPLLLRPDGSVRPVAQPQLLLGVVDGAPYSSETFLLKPGDTLLCVTDGVTERRSGDGQRQFDDGDGLSAALSGCAGLGARGVAERIRTLVHDYSPLPPDDDLALLVLQAR